MIASLIKEHFSHVKSDAFRNAVSRPDDFQVPILGKFLPDSFEISNHCQLSRFDDQRTVNTHTSNIGVVLEVVRSSVDPDPVR